MGVPQDAEEGVGDSTADEDAGDDRDGGANGGAVSGPGSVGGACASWVSAVAVCRGTDLLVRLLPMQEGAGWEVISFHDHVLSISGDASTDSDCLRNLQFGGCYHLGPAGGVGCRSSKLLSHRGDLSTRVSRMHRAL